MQNQLTGQSKREITTVSIFQITQLYFNLPLAFPVEDIKQPTTCYDQEAAV